VLLNGRNGAAMVEWRGSFFDNHHRQFVKGLAMVALP